MMKNRSKKCLKPKDIEWDGSGNKEGSIKVQNSVQYKMGQGKSNHEILSNIFYVSKCLNTEDFHLEEHI